MNTIPLLAQAAGGGNFIPLISLGLIFVIFYVFIIGPQKKEQKKTQQMIAGAKKGDKIVTIGGIYGVISSAKDTSVILKVDDNCKLEIRRSAIASIILDDKAKTVSEKDTAAKASGFSLFGKKEKKTNETDAEKPNPPDFSSGKV